uniref:Transmembrane domain-containing protein n=1 Tax=Trepomonas sp. PC1 TaxID=1076344 RepID=A0A146KCG0_9EUKA|eukprot:JAP94472.1 Transmembrane domain-containing protein [Trepomonas sp. PC1]
MDLQTAEWNIERSQHYEVIALSRLDNLILSTSLFILGYFSLFSLSITQKMPQLIDYTFYITMMIITYLTQVTCISNSIIAFKLKKLGFSQFKQLEIKLFNDQPNIILSTVFIRALLLPILINLMWSFIAIDFQIGSSALLISLSLTGSIVIIIIPLVFGCIIISPR